MSDLRDDIENAMAESEESDEVEAPEPVEVEAAPVEGPVEVESVEDHEPVAAKEVRDEKGRFKPKKSAVVPKLKDSVAPVVEAKTAPLVEKPQAEAAKPAVETSRAPGSWKPLAREKWNALPPEVQQEVVRREREATLAMQEGAEARKFHQAFQQTVSPYEGMIRAEGSNPMQAVGTLLQAAGLLRTGPAPLKAQMVADLVRTYSIPIDLLDHALSGQPLDHQQQRPQTTGYAQQVQQQQFRDPRVDQLLQQRDSAVQQKSIADVQEFASKAEFFDDVRETMSDLMEVAAKRNLPLKLEDAYNRAVQLHPDISKVLQQREAAKRANANQASTQRARNAASSIRSQPTGAIAAPQPDDLRSTLEAAWSEASGR